MSTFTTNEMREQKFRQRYCTEKIHFHDLAVNVNGSVFDQTPLTDPAVVDQNIDVTEDLNRSFGRQL